MTVQANFQSYIGEDVSLPVTIYADAAETTPANITGWAIQFVVHATGGPALLTQTTANNGIVLTNPTAGVLTVSLPAAVTAGLTAASYCFRVERTDTGLDAVLTIGTWFLLGK